MTRKLLTLSLILFVAATLQSQKSKRTGDETMLTDTIIPQLPVPGKKKADSSAFYNAKLDSVNSDINKTVSRVERKVEQIPWLVDRVVRTMQHNSRPRMEISEITTKQPSIVLPEPFLDTNSAAKHASKRKILWIFNRD